uniref:Uncharacterized protein n=1 Tax=Lynx canadensis TaxID=61383 RepID=A0A667HWU1_LYNCA
MTQLCLPRPKALAYPIPVPPRGLGAGEGSCSPVGPHTSPWGPNLAQLLDSVLGLGALGLTIWDSLFHGWPSLWSPSRSPEATCSLHRPADAPGPQHTLLMGGRSQGAGEGPGQREAVLLPTAAVVPGRLSPHEALLLLLLGLGLFLGARGVPVALLGLAFCLHPWI